MAEDYGLCTYEKHHKLKILLFLSSMRSFSDELKSKNFNIIYKDINKDFKLSYEKKITKTIKEKKIKEISFFEIEDKFFEKKILYLAKKNSLKINQIKSPMFLIDRNETTYRVTKVTAVFSKKKCESAKTTDFSYRLNFDYSRFAKEATVEHDSAMGFQCRKIENIFGLYADDWYERKL